MCDTKACQDCYGYEKIGSGVFCCPACLTRVTRLKKTPGSYLRAKYVKAGILAKGITETQNDTAALAVVENDSQETNKENNPSKPLDWADDEMDSIDPTQTQDTLPLGQGERSKTVLEDKDDTDDEEDEEEESSNGKDDDKDEEESIVDESQEGAFILSSYERKKIRRSRAKDDDTETKSDKEKNKSTEKTVAKVDTTANMSKENDTSKIICKYFVKGLCKHGMLGRTSKEGKDSCRFMHPKVCQRWISNSYSDSPQGVQ